MSTISTQAAQNFDGTLANDWYLLGTCLASLTIGKMLATGDPKMTGKHLVSEICFTSTTSVQKLFDTSLALEIPFPHSATEVQKLFGAFLALARNVCT